MADNNLQALFGGTMLPQDMQQELINKRAREFAQLTPSQQLGSMGYKTGAAIGGGLAQAMGVDITDPQIKRMTTLQALSQGVEPTPDGLKTFAKKLAAAGFNAEAAMAMEKAVDLDKEQSVITKNLREGNAAMLTTDQRNYAQAKQEGYKGTFNQWLTEQSTAKGTKINMPEIKLPADVNAIISSYEKAVEGDVEVKNLAGTAKGLINQAATSNNPSAWEAARTQTAKAIGQGKLSNEDIARIGVDPTLIGGLRDWIDKKVVGVPDANTQKALYSVASYLETTAGGRIAEKRNSRIAAAKAINPAIDTGMMFPDYAGKGGNAPSPAGSGKIVDFKDLKVNK